MALCVWYRTLLAAFKGGMASAASDNATSRDISLTQTAGACWHNKDSRRVAGCYCSKV
jgi:hypothetical protein